MKQLKLLLFLMAFSCALTTAQEAKHLVILQSFKKPKALLGAEIKAILMSTAATPSPEEYANPITNKIQSLRDNGFSPYLIQTDDYPSLRKGLWALVIGPFDKTTAKSKQQQVQAWVKDAYIRTVKPPVAQQTPQGFSTVNTYIDDAHCMMISYDFKFSASVNNLCQGFDQYSVFNAWGDQYNTVEITHNNQVWNLFTVNQPGLVLDITHPITWIYQNEQLFALSAVIEEASETPRYAVYVGEAGLCQIDKRFKAADIEAVLTYLKDSPSNCL